jgi:molecular chaperone GrpE
MNNNQPAPDAEPLEDALDAENTPDGTDNPAPDTVGDFMSMEAEIANLRAEKQAFVDKLARVQADFTNSRKRLESDVELRLAYANQSLIESLLPTLDNFDRALQQDPAKVDAAAILKGMTMVSEGLNGVLKKFHVEEVCPRAGDDFDPQLHQAVMQQPSDLPEGKVTMLLQKGYTMKGRVLRAAQVAVAAAK